MDQSYEWSGERTTSDSLRGSTRKKLERENSGGMQKRFSCLFGGIELRRKYYNDEQTV